MVVTEWAINGNMTTIPGLMEGINNAFVSGGSSYLISYAILIIVFVITFAATKGSYPKEYSFAYASFLTFIISVLLWAMAMLPFLWMSVCFFAVVLSLIFSHFYSSGGV